MPFFKCQPIFFFIFYSFCLNNRHTNVILVSIFENTQKKLLTAKTAKMVFLMVNSFFYTFSKIPTKKTYVRLLFLELNQGRNTQEKIGWGFFFKNQKRTFWGSKIVVIKTQI